MTTTLVLLMLLALSATRAAAAAAGDAPPSPPSPTADVCASVRTISAFAAAHCDAAAAAGEPQLPSKCVASFREYARDADVFKRCEAAGSAGDAAALTAFKRQYAQWQQTRVCGAFRAREAQAARECAGDNVHRPWNAATWPLFCHQTFRSYAANRRELDALCGSSASSAAFLEGFADYVATPTCKAYYDAVRGAARLQCGESDGRGDQCTRLFRWYAEKQREVETDCLELHNARPFYRGFYRWKRKQPPHART